MTLSTSVVSSVARKGVADVMAFVSPESSAPGRRRRPIQLAPEDIARCFLSDHRSVLLKAARLSGRERTKAQREQPAHLRYFPKLGIVCGTADGPGLQRMLDTLPVQHVSGPLQASLVRPIDRIQIARPTLEVSWGIAAMGVPALWNRGLTGSGISVGHLDTGIDSDHPTLRGAMGDFAFFDDGGDLDPFQTQAFDTDEHGTHTAATIAGRPVLGKHVGVAPGASLASGVIIEGGLAQVRIIAGMEWAIQKKVRILNVSLGIRGFTEDFHLLTRRMRDLGVLPVFAVGNEGVGTSRAPGNYDEALSVGASDENGAVPLFSSSDEIEAGRMVPDLVAPGSHVQSAMPDGGYLSMSGTSMAAPHIAGLAALLLEANPQASVDQLERAIFASCRQGAGMEPDRAGLGMPQAEQALQEILN